LFQDQIIVDLAVAVVVVVAEVGID